MRMSELLNEVRSFTIDEGFSPREIKMAIGIASDPRYAKGNMTGAVNAIEKMKKGLSKHPQVAAVLKRQNENLDEAKFQINYSKGGKLFSKTISAKDEDDAESKAIKQFKIEDDDIRSVVKEAVSPAQQAAIAISKKERGEKPKKEGNTFGKELKAARDKGEKTFVVGGKTYNVEDYDIKEDGHTDVASAVRQCKTVTEDAMQILQKLQSMSPEESLPSWWTNKLAVASNSMNKLRDYFLVPSVSEEVELNEAEVNVYGFISTGERKKFLDNLKSMRLQFKSKVMNLPVPAPASGVLNFDANQSTIEAIIKFAKRNQKI